MFKEMKMRKLEKEVQYRQAEDAFLAWEKKEFGKNSMLSSEDMKIWIEGFLNGRGLNSKKENGND